MADTLDPLLPPDDADEVEETAAPVEADDVVEVDEVVELIAVEAEIHAGAGSEAEDEAEDGDEAGMPVPIAEMLTGAVSVEKPAPPRPASAPPAPARPDLADRREPLYRECRGYRLRLDPPDLARLRELPGSRGRSDSEIGETFFDGQAERLAASIADDVPAPSEIRVVVDPYSRQAFLALENRIRGILSF